MRHAVERLRLADNRRIAVEELRPHLIADHGDRMSVATEVFSRFKRAAQNRMDSQCFEIVGGHDAGCFAVSSIADGQCSAHDAVHDERVEQCAVPLEIDEVGPGDIVAAAHHTRSGDGHHSFLVNDKRKRAEQDSFNPTEDGGVGADAESQAKNREAGKTRIATEHAETEAEVLPQDLDDWEGVGFAVDLFGLRNAAESPEGFQPRLLRGHAIAEIFGDLHL